MGKINVLSFAVANLIAAGEVVDRPASVIKELMENAIDAGATRIAVELQNGGVTLMRVSDNGCGIAPEDLPIAIRRHATSKIKSAEDLDGIETLGFRGEALAAIASVSDLRILSKTEGAEFGAILEAHGGDNITVSERGCPFGTTVIVENLFANVPARRKFLKKDITETLAVSANVEKVALSHPEIAVRLVADGATKLETAGDGILLNTIYALYGKDFASRLLEVTAEGEGVNVRGYIGRTDLFKGNRNCQDFFVNGRYVKSKTAMSALEQAYTSYMPPEKYPCCVLFLDIAPGKVDVNVHPAKLEVKFSNEKEIFEQVYYAARTALQQNVTRPEMALPNAKKPFAYPGGKISNAVFPEQTGFDKFPATDRYTFDPEKTMQKQPQERWKAEDFRAVYGKENRKDGNVKAWQEKISGMQMKNPFLSPLDPEGGREKSLTEMQKDVKDALKAPAEPKKTTDVPTKAEDFPKMPETVMPVDNALPKNVFSGAEELPYYRIIGEVFHSYILVETEEKLLIIDQHAAHERILFEDLKAGLSKRETVSQMLMLPLDVMLTAGEVGVLKDYDAELNQIGFSMTYAKNTVSVSAIPEGVESSEVSGMLQTMAGRLLDNTGSIRLTRDVIFEKALYQGACKAAIKAGKVYEPEHLEWLVKKLMALPDITFCPHGRPVAMELSKKKLDRQFDRTGF